MEKMMTMRGEECIIKNWVAQKFLGFNFKVSIYFLLRFKLQIENEIFA